MPVRLFALGIWMVLAVHCPVRLPSPCHCTAAPRQVLVGQVEPALVGEVVAVVELVEGAFEGHVGSALREVLDVLDLVVQRFAVGLHFGSGEILSANRPRSILSKLRLGRAGSELVNLATVNRVLVNSKPPLSADNN